jgi:protein-disulfide isomerase
MKAGFSAVTLAVALILSGCGGDESGNLSAATGNSAAPLPQIPAPNNGDWSQVVSRTEDGGLRMGNPDAPVKLVEYASLTCPHCAAFSEEASATLRDTYVRSGQVSWEFRNFLLGAPDVALSALARCQPPAAYFGTVEQIFAQQQELVGGIDEAETQRIQPLPPEQRIAPLARAMDLDTFFARRGMPEARFNECLANRQGIQQLEDMTSRAVSELQVQGTPTFFINGEKQDVSEWSALEPRLRAAIGG